MHQGAEESRLTETLSHIGRKYVVLSGKGGVGKSTVAVNLSVGLALRGKRVGLLDSDLHGPSVPKMLGLENFVSAGDEPLSVVQTAKPDGAVVVTTPQEIATFDVRKSIDFCEKLKLPITGIIENMSGFVCSHCNEVTDIFGSGGGEKMAAELGVPFLGRIPLEPDFVIHSDRGRSFIDVARTGKGYEALMHIVDAIAA